jgi:iron complex transport system substrate-binding protein
MIGVLCLLLVRGTTPAIAQGRGGGAGGPQRVISLIPSVTDIIIALGQQHRLVARTDYDLDPALGALPSVGGTIDPSIERITVLAPDLVVVWRSLLVPPATAAVRRLGIPTLALGTETIAELWDTIDSLGAHLGCRASADSLRRAIADTLAAVRSRPRHAAPVSVVYVVGLQPPIAAGPGTFIDDLIGVAGGRNVLADAPTSWPTVAMETLVQRNPDLVIWPVDPAERVRPSTLRAMPPWATLPAVRAGRVLLVDRDLFDRPGPRLGRAARALAASLDSVGAAHRGDTR